MADVARGVGIRFRSKVSEVEAVQWTGTTIVQTEVDRFAPGKVQWPRNDRLVLFAGKDGAQGWVRVPVGHWLVRNPGDESDIWPVDPDYFANKYEDADALDEGDDIVWHLRRALHLLSEVSEPEVNRWRSGALDALAKVEEPV